MYGDGAADEADIIDALHRLLALALGRSETHRRSTAPLDAISLSFGYYHETPSAVENEAGLFRLIRAMQANGVCVVAAAGNGATTLPFWPAALAADHAVDIKQTGCRCSASGPATPTTARSRPSPTPGRGCAPTGAASRR